MNEGRDSPVPPIENRRSDSPALPPTPLLWFEFLLKPGLLESHLSSENPEPSATLLLEQFVDQSIKEANNEESPSQHRKIHSLKVLALKVAAHLKWDFSFLQTSLPLYMVHKVLKDFVEWVSPPELNIQPTTDVCSLDDSVLVALTIYNRWSVRTFVERSVPSKLIKTPPGNVPGAFNVAGVNDMVMKTVKDTLPDSLNFLERCLPLDRDIYFPDTHTFIDIDAFSSSSPTPSSSANANSSLTKLPAPQQHGIKVTKEEFLWQLNYDLGCYSFHEQQYGKAADMFQRVQELSPKVETSFYCCPEASKLEGYLAACSALIGQNLNRLPSNEPPSLLSRCEASKARNYQDIVAVLLEDNFKQELSMWYRECLGDDVAKSAITPSKLKQQVALCNSARLAAEGRMNLNDLKMNLAQSPQEARQFFVECIVKTLSSSSEHQKSNIKSLLRLLFRDDTLCTGILEGPLSVLFSEDERQEFLRCCKPEEGKQAGGDTSQRDQHSDNQGLQMGQLELKLLLTQDPNELESVLRALHKMTPNRRFSAVCSKWQIDRSYGYIIDAMNNRLVQDFIFILLVKAQHCIEKKSYDAAINHLEAACKNTKDSYFRLYTGVRNEILYVELLRMAEQKGAKTAGPDFKQMVLACLLGTRSDRDIQPREPVLDQCILFLLNSQYWLCFFNADIPLPFWRISKFIALCMKDDPSDTSKCRPVAKELSQAMVSVFGTTIQTKRNVTGGNAATVTRETSTAIMTRVEFVNFVKSLYDDRCLSLVLSCLVKIYNLLKDDVTNELSHEYPALWPNTITNPGSVDIDAVATTLHEVIGHAVSMDPMKPEWLCTLADARYAKKQFGSALKFYLQAAMVSTQFFENPIPKTVWTEQVYKRCIKACSGLQCHTQAAILCQFLQPIDYVTAFQALQEKRCYDGSDSLYSCFWDLAILEFLVFTHHKRSEMDKEQAAMEVLSQAELNTCNSETVLAAAARKRQKLFLQSMAKQYL
nr:integrator complex subunit 8-like [Lytechinus pictus]